jgi:hypothetical protein
MLYNKSLIIKRLQENENELLTEKELLALATPYINNIEQVIASVKNAIDKGYTGEYAINCVSRITAISRQTLYRWEKDGIIKKSDNGLNINHLYDNLILIKNRQVNV